MPEYDEYDDYDRPRRSRRTRERSPEYVTETKYVQRGTGVPSRDLIYRPRDPEDSIEDIPRDFPPPGAEYRRTTYRDEYGPPRRARSAGRRGYDDYDDRSDYGGPAAAGAAAGYAAGRRGGRHRRDDDGYYSDQYDRPRQKDRRKSRIEETLGELGLGGVVAGVLGKARSRSRGGGHRRRDSSSDSGRSTRSRRRSRSGGADSRAKWQQAAKAALLTGVVEGFRSRNEPGGWAGPKGQRVATAALGAAGIDGLMDRNPGDHGKRHVLESMVGGLAANRLANGSRAQSKGPGGRGRSTSATRSQSIGARLRSRSRSVFGRGRSQSRGGSQERGGGGGNGLKEVAALGGIAAAGKAIYDRVRSKSRKRRSPSASSEDSYVPARRQRYQKDRGGEQSDDDYEDDQKVAHPRGRNTGSDRDANERKRNSSESSVSTTDLENRRKRTRGKELLTAGLASVATIHAAHGVYSSMVASEKRHKLVMEGEMSPEEARKRKSKNMLQDAAAVGIAALGIKSAFGEWKEMQEQRESLHELEARRRRRKKAKERMGQNNPFGMGMNGANPFMIAAPIGMYPPPGPSAYQDGNPYGAGAMVPPPPMGAPPQQRY